MATTTPTESPDAAKVAAVAAGLMGLALSGAAVALYGPRTALSVGAGATIAVANLVTMRAIIRALVRSGEAEEADEKAAAGAKADAAAKPDSDADGNADDDAEDAKDTKDHVSEGKRGGAAWGAFALLKIVVLFGGIWILLTRGLVDPIPLVVGYGVLPLGIAASSLFTSLAPRSTRKSRRS